MASVKETKYMSTSPLLSVIVPAYKVEEFLPRCLDSIIGQTYKNLDIILVDDGSPDQSGAICEAYAQKDVRIRVLHQRNQGLSDARNNGLALAKGDYIAFVDSDDWLDVTMYAKLMDLMQEYNLDIVKCATEEVRGGKVNPFLPKKSTPVKQVILGKQAFELYFQDSLFTMVWNAVYKKSIVQGIFSPSRCHSQDNYVSGRYLYRCQRLLITDEILHFYNKDNEGSVTESGNRRNLDICICTNMLLHDLKQKEGLQDHKYLEMLHYKLSREILYYLRNTGRNQKVFSMTPGLKEYMVYHLDGWRKLRFLILLHKKHILVQSKKSKQVKQALASLKK
jgi:glycosyltransferase involved in cell wall biosynthesis